MFDMAMLSKSSSDRRQPHEQTVADIIADLGSNTRSGLEAQQVNDRQIQYGFNVLRRAVPLSNWKRLLRQLADPQVYLLLCAAAVSFTIWVTERASGDPYESVIILAIVFLNTLLGYLQEGRAERALASLKKMVPSETTVIRDGKQQRLMARELVPGDLILLFEGDSIPADGRLISAQSLVTSESSLTGESIPSRKSIEPVPREAMIGDRSNMVFAGTMVIAGNGRAVVTTTGMETEFGKVAGLLTDTESQLTPLQLQLRQLSKQIGAGVVALAVCVVVSLLVINGVQSTDTVMKVLLFGIALAVAATPEGLATIITLVLAIGVQRMARRGAIVKRLAAAETLGSATVIASDKTGTMTRNEMTVRTIITASGEVEVSGNGYLPEGEVRTLQHERLPSEQREEVEQLLIASVLVNNAKLNKDTDTWTVQGDPTEGALLVAAKKVNIQLSRIHSSYPRIAEIVFSSERKRMTTIHEVSGVSGKSVAFSKGAPDILLQFCKRELYAGQVRPLTVDRVEQILRDNERLTSKALRTLGVAMRTIEADEVAAVMDSSGQEVERDLTFLGLVGMMDPPRPEVRLAVERARAAGIRTILITGDHPGTAMAVARELHICSDCNCLIGMKIDQISDVDLLEVVRTTDVYARVKPEHKFRIVKALQQNGEIVAMTGDGVNDAPALKAAEIGIAMGITGTEVAKEAADLILTDDNFSTIVAAVEEGRIVYDNIRKFLRYLLATNMGEVLTLFMSALILSIADTGGTHSLVLPLTAAQILWVNLITDGAPALALGVDSASADIMSRPPRRSDDGIVDREMTIGLFVVATVMAVGTMSAFFLLADTKSIEYKRSLAFTTLILLQLFNSFSSRSGSQSAFTDIFVNRWLWAAIALSLGLQYFVLNVPLLQTAFGVMSLSGRDWLLILAISSSVLWASEILKFFFRRSNRSRSRLEHQLGG